MQPTVTKGTCRLKEWHLMILTEQDLFGLFSIEKEPSHSGLNTDAGLQMLTPLTLQPLWRPAAAASADD